MSVFAIITIDGLDQLVSTRAIADREKSDLIRLGCHPVQIREFPDEASALDWCDAHLA